MISHSPSPFPIDLGKIVATHGAHDALQEANDSGLTLLMRHAYGDWGEVCEEDKKLNDEAVRLDNRILSAYTLATGVKLWIITEADRSVTTLLLPSEY